MDPFLRELFEYQQAAQRQKEGQRQQLPRRALYSFPVTDGDEGYDTEQPYGYGRQPYYTRDSPFQRQGYRHVHPYAHPYGYQRRAAPVYASSVGMNNPLYFKLNRGSPEATEGDVAIGRDEEEDNAYAPTAEKEVVVDDEPQIFQRNPFISGEPASKRHAHAFVRPQDATPDDDSRYYGYVRPQKLDYVEHPTESKPMYVMDRYGNLYPYSGSNNTERDQLNARELINMLLGGQGGDENGDSKQGESAEREEEPLTKKTLADLLSKIAQPDEKEVEAAAAAEQKEAEKEEVPNATEAPTSFVSASAPAPVKRQSTVPELKVHSATETTNAATTSVAEDVKVSAPQLKSKNLPFSPPVNIYEFKSKYIVVVSIPGVGREFVDIDYHPSRNELVIKGEVKNQYLSEDDEVANSFILKLSEQRFGKFERVVKLPAYPGIEDGAIKAKFKDGMLEIKLPKVDESKANIAPKKIMLENVADEELQRESQDMI